MADASRMLKPLQDELRAMPGNDVCMILVFDVSTCVLASVAPLGRCVTVCFRAVGLLAFSLAALRGLWCWRAAVGICVLWYIYVP